VASGNIHRSAYTIRVRGVVQGVGFRPFVHRLAHAHNLSGWIRNGAHGVEIVVEGSEEALQSFMHNLKAHPPAAATIAEFDIQKASPTGTSEFTICESWHADVLSARISPDLSVCGACLTELLDPADRRYWYPYINCTNCGPRYSVITALPYDRPHTTMCAWPMDEYCQSEYRDPANRRFHAQPVACPSCGPAYFLSHGEENVRGSEASIRRAAELLLSGTIVSIKGLGGYHLACDASNAVSVAALRARKFRKEKPFAIMTRNLSVAREVVELSAKAESMLTSSARPIVLAPAKTSENRPASGVALDVAPDNCELGVMLPYTPLHHLLFAAGAPEALVMTSANLSSEPIAYEDKEALDQLSGIADAFLIGERPIARRVDDSVVRAGIFGPVILRRSRGYAPGAVATFPAGRPILAVGADLKNTITLVVEGQAFVSQHIGDLDHYQSLTAFRETIQDLLSMYEVRPGDLLVAHDAHPQYYSTSHAAILPSARWLAVQHHRAHIASVLAERGDWTEKVLGVSFDGTGYGDDDTIWGGEIFVGSIKNGFERVAHLRPASLPGGDAAAEFPVQAAAGFLSHLDGLPNLCEPPFNFPSRYRQARALVQKGVRSFATTSVGRLFDTVAALLGFTRETSFEGQAAVWLEQLASRVTTAGSYPFPNTNVELDFRPLLQAVVRDRLHDRPPSEIARAFHRGLAEGLSQFVSAICKTLVIDTVILSGGVFQNQLLLKELKILLEEEARLKVWTNQAVPPNDGGISLGQAALAAFAHFE
jgi:hydrogenase maturation protein HypF